MPTERLSSADDLGEALRPARTCIAKGRALFGPSYALHSTRYYGATLASYLGVLPFAAGGSRSGDDRRRLGGGHRARRIATSHEHSRRHSDLQRVRFASRARSPGADVTGGRESPSWRPLWLRFVGPLAALALLSRVDLREIAAALADVRMKPLAASLVLAAPLFVVKAWRWRLLLRACGQYVSLRDASWLYTIAAGAGALTPGAVGDFWKGMSPAVGDRSVGLWTSAIDRLYDVAILLVLGMTIATAWSPRGVPRLLVASVLGGTMLGVFAGRRRLFGFAASRLPRSPQAAGALHGSVGAAAAATIVATIIAYGRFELLVVALGLRLAWRQVFIAFVLSSGVAALPLSVAGLGTRDLALIGYLRGCGVSSADAIALSSLCRSLFLWNGVLAACLWFAEPVRRD
jgi:hypothetical protein